VLLKWAAIWGGTFVLAGLIFASLRLHPAFGQLFSRGSDFLYPVGDVLFKGLWKNTVGNFISYLVYFGSYLTWPILLFLLMGLFTKKGQKTNHLLWWSALLFIVPIGILGRVVYPRYFMPALIFLTVEAGLVIENLSLRFAKLKPKNLVLNIFLALLVANSIAMSGMFIFYDWFKPSSTPLVGADKVQLLYEWSSGHGIKETVGLIEEMSQDQTVAVATEGHFGTLPDALVMYFHNKDVSNIYIEGIGQPVHSIDLDFMERAKDFDKTLLVVNSHRLYMWIPIDRLVGEYCRPGSDSPCLMVWDITDLIENYNQDANL
jgi:hypothetical protein